MTIYRIPLTSIKDIRKRLDAIKYQATCNNEKVARNLLNYNFNQHKEIFLVLSDKGDYINWQYDTYGQPYKEITLDTICYGSI